VQLHNSLVPDSTLNDQGLRAYTFRRLESAWRDFGLDASKLKIAVTELNPIASSPGEMHSLESRYDGVCRASMNLALSFSPKIILAFGAAARRRWLADHQHLRVAAVQIEMLMTGGQVMHLLLPDGKKCDVHFAPHPSEHRQWPHVLRAIGDVHGVPDAVTRTVVEASSQKRVRRILGLEDHGPAEFTAVQVKSEAQRFVLSDGVITHNCVFANEHEVTAWFLGLQAQSPQTCYHLTRGMILWQRLIMKLNCQCNKHIENRLQVCLPVADICSFSLFQTTVWTKSSASCSRELCCYRADQATTATVRHPLRRNRRSQERMDIRRGDASAADMTIES
jgi:hypothetical protein